MGMVTDVSVMLERHMETPYISSGFMVSAHTEQIVMINQIVPTLSGLLMNDNGRAVPMCFVDDLPAAHNLRGIALDREADDSHPRSWLIQFETPTLGWQFTAPPCESSELEPYVLLFKWEPGPHERLVVQHDEFTASLSARADTILTGSAMESEMFSRYLLNSGRSNLFIPLLQFPEVAKALSNPGSEVAIGRCGCGSVLMASIKWQYTV